MISGLLILEIVFWNQSVFAYILLGSLDGIGSMAKALQIQPNIVHSKVTLWKIYQCAFKHIIFNWMHNTDVNFCIIELSNGHSNAQRNGVQFTSLSMFAWCSTSKTDQSHDQWDEQKMFCTFFSVFYLILQDLGPSLEFLRNGLLSYFLCRALWIDMGEMSHFYKMFYALYFILSLLTIHLSKKKP